MEGVMSEQTKPCLAVIGGSGLYEMEGLLDKEIVEMVDLNTPFGLPSDNIVIGTLEGRRVAFLARHGRGHRYMPGEVPYRANIWALKSLGVNQIVSVSAVGSLREDFAPRDIVIPHQIFDRTNKRTLSFFGEGIVAHIGFAEPFCPVLSEQLYQAVLATGEVTVHKGGNFIVVEGPRFSTKAESNTFRQWGMDIIGMTAVPEAQLAREAEMCYATMAHVTDYDVWHETEEPVSVEAIIKNLMANTQVAQRAIRNLIPEIRDTRECGCGHALANAIITRPDAISEETKHKLHLLIAKYV
jgi:5'-methylthioadenosine phosphorylase